MATMFPFSFTAAQVGSYFVGQYYQVLQQQPEFAHQFYSDTSTMLRIDANTREAASGMLQIHTLIMSLHYTGIEIKTAHFLKSWNGGVLVMVTGSIHVKNFNGSKKFVQTFFLAPQDKSLFVLNDIFHIVDEEQSLQHPVAYLGQANLDAKLNTSAATGDQVSNNDILGREIHARDFVTPVKTEENGAVLNNFAEEQPQQVLKDDFAVPYNGSIPSMDTVEDQFSAAAIEEPVSEPQKHTYASIVAKLQSVQAIPPQCSLNKSAAPPSEWQHVQEPHSQPAYDPSNTLERSGAEVVEECLATEDELEVKSVYVRNVPKTMESYEIEEEFKKFGRIRHDGVAIRTRKDIDVCYAFVEFEDVTSVQNAIKAYTVQIGGNQLYIEGRKPSRNNFPRGRGRGRGRIGYQSEGRGGRFGGRGFGRVLVQDGPDGGDHDHRSRGSGFYRQVPHQDRAFSYNGQF